MQGFMARTLYRGISGTQHMAPSVHQIRVLYVGARRPALIFHCFKLVPGLLCSTSTQMMTVYFYVPLRQRASGRVTGSNILNS